MEDATNMTEWSEAQGLWSGMNVDLGLSITVAQMIDAKYASVVGPFPLVIGPFFSGNQQSLVLNPSWPSLIGCHRSCRPRTNGRGPTISCLSFQLL